MDSSIYDRLTQGITTYSPKESIQIGIELGRSLPANSTLCLYGDLGSGKTTLTQGLAQSIEISEAITSPTYNIYNIYKGPQYQLIHMDAYRLKSPHQWEELMIDEFITEPYLFVIEWPEKIESILPIDKFTIHLSCQSHEHRHIRLLP